MRASLGLLLLVVALVLAACGGAPAGGATGNTTEGGNTAAGTGPVIVAWLPNESGSNLTDARDALGAVISEALNRPVEHRTTTDYIIAIETLANNNAHLGFFGAEAYV
jgi:phosphonate transport system substrate-binding protein